MFQWKILFCFLLMAIGGFKCGHISPAKKSPNIVFIVADDMGFDDVSFRGNKEFLTPNIDALAYHGKILNRLYTPAICTPSRGALLTGRYPIHTGTQHYVISNPDPWALPTNVSTIAQIFKAAGYSTNLIGKWHLGFARKEFTPTFRGFDYHYGYWGGYIDYYQRMAQMEGNNSKLGFDFRKNLNVECESRETYLTDLLTNEAVRIIERNNGEQPLLLHLHHLAPHTGNINEPLQAPLTEQKKFEYIKHRERRIYAAMVSKLDQSIGRVVQALKKSNMLDNSIIIFMSDNGAPAAGLFENTGSNWPLRGQKNTPWEGGVRVAGAIWSPLLKQRSTIFQQPIYVGDFLPTLAEAANIQLPIDLQIDGISLWSQLVNASGRATAPLQREVLHFLDDQFPVESLMLGDWKYINGTTNNGNYDGVINLRELYDLDPREERYVVEIRNSLTSKILQTYDEKRLTMARINSLRDEAAVRCGDFKRGCNALVEACLFNLALDPCEQNNLIYEPKHREVVEEMRSRLAQLRASAWPIRNRKGIAQYEPVYHGCIWNNFLENNSTKEPIECSYDKHPCDFTN